MCYFHDKKYTAYYCFSATLPFSANKSILNSYAKWALFSEPVTFYQTLFSIHTYINFMSTLLMILEKWFPLQGEPAHSLYFFVYALLNLPKVNIPHRLQVHYLTLTFIIHNEYISTLYLYTYIYIMICSNHNTKMILLI